MEAVFGLTFPLMGIPLEREELPAFWGMNT